LKPALKLHCDKSPVLVQSNAKCTRWYLKPLSDFRVCLCQF